MKKFICLVMSIIMVLGCITVVLADESLESLTAMVKTRLDIPEEYTVLETSRSQTENGEILRLEWRTEDDKWISAAVTDSGIITDYYNSEVKLGSGISKFSAKEAAEKANEWMKKINPSISAEYIFAEEDVRLGYGIHANTNRFVNGIRVDGNYASVGMSNQTGEVCDFYITYTNYEFEKPENIISQEEAANKFGEHTNLILAYMNTGENKAIPVYINFEGQYQEKFGIDAFTGEYVPYQRKYYYRAYGDNMNMAYAKAEAAADEMKQLTEAEKIEISKYDNCISKEDAAAKVKSIKEFGLDGFNLKNANYEKWVSYEKDGQKELGIILSLYFTSETGDASASLDAVSGEILDFSRYIVNDKKENNSVNTEKTADSVAEKIFKGRKYTKAVSKDGRYVYLEDLNGLPYVNSLATINVDGATGLVSNLYTQWERNEVNAMPYDNVIAHNMAQKLYLSESEYELCYQDIYGSDAMPLYKIEMTDKEESVYKLLYLRKSTPYCINAVTGIANTSSGEEYKDEIKAYSDIEGHWCEKAVKALVDNGFLNVSGEKFNPDANITAKEAQEMMNGADLYRYDIEKADDATLSRSEAAKAIVCGAGYEKIGALSDIYIPVFADWNSVYDGYKGYVALAKGMGIINGDKNGFFNPKAEVTKGAFAVMIYNYIMSAAEY